MNPIERSFIRYVVMLLMSAFMALLFDREHGAIDNRARRTKLLKQRLSGCGTAGIAALADEEDDTAESARLALQLPDSEVNGVANSSAAVAGMLMS